MDYIMPYLIANRYLVTQLAHYGYHIADLAKMPYDYKAYSLVSFVNTLFYYPVLGLVKVSMILLYLRLGGTKRGVQIGCYILLLIISGHTLGTSIADIFQCLPVPYAWDRVAMDQAAQVSKSSSDCSYHVLNTSNCFEICRAL